jgi:hypothetical protein
MIEVRVHIAVEDDNVSVRHLWCCGTLLRGRLMRFMRFSVCVNHGSTLELRTTLTEVARGAKAAAEAGRSCGGIEECSVGQQKEDIYRATFSSKRFEGGGVRRRKRTK